MRTSLLALGWTILLALTAANLPAAEPGNACGPAALGSAPSGPEASLHQRLMDLDRELRRSLTAVVRNAGRLDPAALADDAAGFSRALRDLERRAHGLEATAATRWRRKVRRLDGLLANLERAAVGVDPAGALPRRGARRSAALRLPSPTHLAPPNDDCADALAVVPGRTTRSPTTARDTSTSSTTTCRASTDRLKAVIRPRERRSR